MDKNLIVKAICPNCKKISEFSMTDENEKRAFRFKRHDCPKCAKKFLANWDVRY